ncbi:MAG: hydroxylamine oxidase [Caldithrix sp.]|nr:hydroxylamine oxidase [Caldithrix sp.]
MKTSVIMVCGILLGITTSFLTTVQAEEPPVSAETEECLMCHSMMNPGLVASWRESRHSKITPEQGMQKSKLQKRVSSTAIDSALQPVVVGCYECHALNTDQHADAFEHNGYTINVVVSPNDCAACHATERQQYSRNIMAHAYGNLVNNAVYQDLIRSVNNPHHYADGQLGIGKKDTLTNYESCLYCHGTKIEVTGTTTKETDYGTYTFPVLEGWPNQGVGRINPDGSMGACTSCHPRHAFSIETARKPYTCSECHKGPDVPAFKVYEVSKHGNIFKSRGDTFDYTRVPWTMGQDFTVPTCATCHVSLVVSPDNTVIAERTHQFNDRLAWRLFGVPYAHPHPKDADLSNVRNADGLPLAVELNGEPVDEFVISEQEQQKRNQTMQAVCLSCHNSEWVDNHFKRLHNTIEQTNKITAQGTQLIMEHWQNGYAQGLPQQANMFDEAIERTWTSIWLFYANSTRFASAMAGGGDYGVFANGRYQTTEQLYQLLRSLEERKQQDQQ